MPPRTLENSLQLLRTGILCDTERTADATPYKDIPRHRKVILLSIRNCLVEYDLRRLLTRYRDTLNAVAVTYPSITSDEDQSRFPDVLQTLGCALKELPVLQYVRVAAAWPSCFSSSFLQNLVQCDKLRTLLLVSTTFDFGDVKFRFPQLERISIRETAPFVFENGSQSINLADLNTLKAVCVWARRPLILPANAALVALEISEILSLEHQGSLVLEVLRAKNCPLRIVKTLIIQSKNLRQLTIACSNRTYLKNFAIDARGMDYLSLTNIDRVCIFSSAEKPLTALHLSRTTLDGPKAGDIFAKSLCLAYDLLSAPSQLMAKICPSTLKVLVIGPGHLRVPLLTEVDKYAMATITRVTDGLEVFGTFAPIKELPSMPHLKCLGIYSYKPHLLKNLMPRGLHLGLSSASMDDHSFFTSVPSHYLLGNVVAKIACYVSEYGFWEAMNARTDVLNFKPYSFDWTH